MAAPPFLSTAHGHDYLVKLLLIGESGVGKSCMILRYADDAYEHNYVTTIGVDFKIKTVTIDGKRVKLQIWDTAGQERFRTITSSYYRGAHGVIVVYDITDALSFERAGAWFDEVTRYASPDVARLLVGNKCDLAARRAVPCARARAYAETLGVAHIETSALNAEGIEAAFTELAREAIVGLSGGALCRVASGEINVSPRVTLLANSYGSTPVGGKRRGCAC